MLQYANEFWAILVESAAYVLFGFFVAGLLKAYLPEGVVAKHLRGNDARSVFKASIFGVPLPLCSCGVIPAAVQLRKQGASRGATASFLVSVPETGADSIAITWALLDPLMALIRPLSSLLTAISAGLLINRLPEEALATANEPESGASCRCEGDAGVDSGEVVVVSSGVERLKKGMSYAFGDLLGDIGRWLLLGIAIAALISALVPDDFIVRYLANENLSLLLMLAVGIPIYICASASTPLAAALVLKGLSPGAALVFLLAGPATNAATITVISRYLGRRAMAVYLLAIAFCSLLFGWLTNRLYHFLDIDIRSWGATTLEYDGGPLLFQLAAVLLLLLIARSLLPKK
jgi:uncharacterized membrane protein YraQ (UPF0718 family)